MAKDADKARMHTAEHVLNQTMVRLFDRGRSFSAHINPKKSKCDYHFDRPITDEEALEIEERVNRVLEQDLPVTEEHASRGQAGQEFDLNRLPDSAGEEIRIIRVGDYDACPCSGEHVERTSQVGRFRLTTHTFEDGVLRLRFKLAKTNGYMGC